MAKGFIGGARATNRYKICHGRVTGAPEADVPGARFVVQRAEHAWHTPLRFNRAGCRAYVCVSRGESAREYGGRFAFRRITATRDSGFAPSPNKLTREQNVRLTKRPLRTKLKYAARAIQLLYT